jgi:hypothetical protein
MAFINMILIPQTGFSDLYPITRMAKPIARRRINWSFAGIAKK